MLQMQNKKDEAADFSHPPTNMQTIHCILKKEEDGYDDDVKRKQTAGYIRDEI